MLFKSHKLAGAFFVTIVLLLAVPSLANKTGTPLQNSPVSRVVSAKPATTLDCRKATEYRLVVVKNPSRKSDADPVIPLDLNILVGDEVISKIELPKESEVKNFSLNAVEKTAEGFEVKVDWGGGLYHYEVQFNFRCKDNNFYLCEVLKVSFSTTNPGSGNFLDQKESKIIKIEPNLPIQNFVMTKYL